MKRLMHIHISGFFTRFLELLCLYFDGITVGLDRKWWRGEGRTCSKGAEWNQTNGCRSEDTASVHGAPVQPNELPGCPISSFLERFLGLFVNLF